MTADEKLFHQEIPTPGSRLITVCSPVSPEQRAAHEEAIKSTKIAVRITLDANGEDLMTDAKRADALTRIARDLFPYYGSYHGVIEELANRGALREGIVDQLDIKAIQRGFDYEMARMIKEAEVSASGKIEPPTTATQNDSSASSQPRPLPLVARNLSYLQDKIVASNRQVSGDAKINDDKAVARHCKGTRQPSKVILHRYASYYSRITGTEITVKQLESTEISSLFASS